MVHRLVLITILLMILQIDISAGQSSYEERRAELRELQNNTKSQIESLESQIENYRNRLELASRRYDDMYNEYEELTRLITLQDERIRRMEQEQRQISEEMDLVEENLNRLENELNELIEKYQDTLVYLYKHGRTNEVALIFTSTSINQLLVRSFYLSKFDSFREDQESEIRARQNDFERAHRDLDETGRRNEEVLARIQSEKEELAEQESRQKRNVELLQRDRNQLQDQVDRYEEERRQLDETLTELIEEERQIQLAEERGVPAARTAVVSDDELHAFETTFRESRGQLPWPVEGGTITESFGERVHPVFRTRTNNPGIDIAAAARSRVQTVHDGYVFAVQPLPGFGDVIMVNHGRYITVYGNLSDVYVSRGNVLNRGDVIGLSGDENSIRGEVLFFLIRDGSDNVNPESWIQRPTP